MSRPKRVPCLHCAINQMVDQFLIEQGAEKANPDVQRWVLQSMASVVSDRIMEVHPGYRVIAMSEFLGQTASYVEVESREEITPQPQEGVH